MSAGRYAPSPSGDLHIGNLRTGLLAWLFARSSGRCFFMRIDDLDRVQPGAEQRQLDDLRAMGIDWDGQAVRQSERRDLYEDALARLEAAGLTYPCFCSRREIREAPSAPHGSPDGYPGTCRDLTDAERRTRASERPAAVRLRAATIDVTIHDELCGDFSGPVDDFVLRRNDGAPAYNLASVVDDAEMGIDQVVRGADLLDVAPAQAHLAKVLNLSIPSFVHVPMALNAGGVRLAKRDGAVTKAELESEGIDVFQLMATSLGMEGETAQDLVAAFDPSIIPREPWIFIPPT